MKLLEQVPRADEVVRILRKRIDVRSWSPAAAIYLLVALVLFALMIPQSGLLPAFGLVTSLLITAVLPATAITRHLFRNPAAFQSVIISTILGLGLLAVGGMLSYLTGIYVARWIPSVLAFALWFIPRRIKKYETDRPSEYPKLAILGSLVAFVALIPALWTAIKSQPTTWDGWHQFYVDLPFQIALVGEVSSRVPNEFPWVGEPLSYPWLFHSAMGVWASATGATAAEVVLQAWPILYVGLIPATISIAGWHLTRSKAVAFGAPIVFVLAHGLVFATGLSQLHPLFQISPTRDFAHLFVLLAVLSLKKIFGRGPLEPFNSWWFASLCISSFVAAGAKSSSFPLLLGGVLSATCALVLLRQFRRNDLGVVVGFVVASTAGFLLVVPVRGSNDAVVIDPLTFLGVDTPTRVAASLAVVGILLLAIVGVWFMIGRGNEGEWVTASLIAGVCLAGLVGVAILGHPGLSQLYFWQGAQPLFVIALMWAGSTFYRDHGWAAIVGLLAVFFAGQVLWTISQKPWLVAGAVVFCSTIVSLCLYRKKVGQREARDGRIIAILAVAASAAFVSQGAQLIQIPAGFGGGMTSGPGDSAAIHSSQLEAFDYIRTNSDPADRIISNKHCLGGSLQKNDCNGRWFAASAFSERRVQVEGWAYTPKGNDISWIEDDIEFNDDFITEPSSSGQQALIDNGIVYVYIDKRKPYSTNLSNFSSLVYEGEWARVYQLAEPV